LAATSDVRDWHTKLREVLRCQAVQALIDRHAQFEGDALLNLCLQDFSIMLIIQTANKLHQQPETKVAG